MLYDYLAEFATIARTRSFSKAAIELSISQSALSRHMRALEAELGVELLDRRYSGSVLTEQGRIAFTCADDMVEMVEDMRARLKLNRGRSRVTVYGLSDFPVFSRALDELFKKRGSKHANGQNGSDLAEDGIRLRLLPSEALSGVPIDEAFALGRCDVYVTYSTDRDLVSLGDEFRITELFESQVVAIMDPAHPLASNASLEPSDLDGQVFLRTSESNLNARNQCDNTRELLRKADISYRFETIDWEGEQDWINVPLKNRILLLTRDGRFIDPLVATGRVAVPVNGLARTFVAAYRADDERVAWLEGVRLDELA